MNNKLQVGYIGLGNIGKPSAKHLVCDQFIAHVYDLHGPAVDELVALGAIASTVEQIARSCGHIGICVNNEEQVESVLYGDTGLLENAEPETIIAIHSTVNHASLLKWAGHAVAKGIHLIDAPITGGASAAEAGTLCYMVGGADDVVSRVTPVFETSATSIVHAGAVGTGIILKLCNNLITYAEFMAMSEATRLAEAAGLSVDTLREVGKSNGVVNEHMYMFIKNRQALVDSLSEEQVMERFGPFGRLGEKDLDCALASAAELGLELPSTAHLRTTVFNLFLCKA